MHRRRIGMWMYQNGGGDVIEQKLVKGLNERGVEVITGLNLRDATVTQEGIFCKGARVDNLDLFFSYNSGEQTLYQVYMYEVLNNLVPMVNSFQTFAITEDKLKTNLALSKAGIPTSTFYLCHRDEAMRLKELFDEWNAKIVYKPVDGWGGVGMVLLENEIDLNKILPFLNQTDIRFFYVEKFIENDRSDFRIDVVDGEVMGCYGRKAPDNDWRTNVTSGGQVFLRELNDELSDLAVRAAAAVGADVAGIDILYDKEQEKYIVLEVNGIPAFATPDQESLGLNFNDRKIEKLIDLLDRKTVKTKYME